MQAYLIPTRPMDNRPRTRSALVAGAYCSFRNRLAEALTDLHWKVTEAKGGAEAWTSSVHVVHET